MRGSSLDIVFIFLKRVRVSDSSLDIVFIFRKG